MKTTMFTSMNGCAGLLTALTLAAVNQAGAQNFGPPASGLEIQNLNGSPILGGTQVYTSAFVATSPVSTVTFAFRHDPGFFTFDDASVMDVTHTLVEMSL